jgi:hypothetical protein
VHHGFVLAGEAADPAVVFSKKSKIRQLRLAVSVEKIKGESGSGVLAAKSG